MIVGIGVDRVAMARIEGALARFSMRFVTRIYTDNEHRLAQKKAWCDDWRCFLRQKRRLLKL